MLRLRQDVVYHVRRKPNVNESAMQRTIVLADSNPSASAHRRKNGHKDTAPKAMHGKQGVGHVPSKHVVDRGGVDTDEHASTQEDVPHPRCQSSNRWSILRHSMMI